MDIVAVEVVKVDYIGLDIIDPAEKLARRDMRVVGLLAINARKKGMKLVVEGVANNIAPFSFAHLEVGTGYIALNSRLHTEVLYVSNYSASAAMTIHCIDL
ncbi:hypothetical protein NXW76_15890 [Bacteroides thetaiotaomicron]|nr:hypothetical protein [Bacteroides thetaiotaomicron]